MEYILGIETILYVEDQQASRNFYQKLLRREPFLDVPGMTSFTLAENCKLGLMPNTGIARILSGKTPHPDLGKGIPRCELYFYVNNVEAEYAHALDCGAKLISSVLDRDWGDRACYFADRDGHIIAFAEKITEK